jgi:acetoin:2,6-dichlorophenolindophenol oxidoreductase subunit alpha
VSSIADSEGVAPDASAPMTEGEVGTETLLATYQVMVLIREAEDRVRRLYAEARLPGFIHSYLGQEAVAAGVCAALRVDDWIASHHRGHGHLLAKGGDLRQFFAELYGRATGYGRGKGGSMHVADLDIGMLGANGIVGAGLPIAAGAALVGMLSGSDRVAVAFIGDGATDTGIFHETLNLASLWDLPLVCVVENNGYAEFLSQREHQRIERISDRASAYLMPGSSVDGNDVLAVHLAAREAVARARAGHGPTLIECVTYRWRGHYEGDPQTYRSRDEVATWRERDPLLRAAAILRARGALNDGTEVAIATQIRDEIDAAVQAAEAAPYPDPAEALTDVYADPELVAEGWPS